MEIACLLLVSVYERTDYCLLIQGDEDEALAPQATDNNFQFGAAAANMPQGGFNF